MTVKIFVFKAQKDKIWTWKLELIRVTNNTCFVWSKKLLLALTYVVGITTISFFFQKWSQKRWRIAKKPDFFCDLTAHFCCLEGKKDFQIRFAVRFARNLRSLFRLSSSTFDRCMFFSTMCRHFCWNLFWLWQHVTLIF